MPPDIHFTELGAGPPVVLLHGAPTAPSALLPLAHALADAHRVLVAELPGYGRSPPLAGDYTLARVHAALEAALRGRGAERPALVGFSGGGYHALALAVRGRLQVRALVSLGGFATFSEEQRAAMRQFAAAVRARVPLEEVLAARFLSAGFAAAHPQAVVEVKGWLGATTPEVLAAELDALAGCEDLRPLLASVAAPVVCRVGELDLACPPAASEDIVRHAPQGRLEVVPRAGHSLLHEDLAGTLASVRRVLCGA